MTRRVRVTRLRLSTFDMGHRVFRGNTLYGRRLSLGTGMLRKYGKYYGMQENQAQTGVIHSLNEVSTHAVNNAM
jgi:hypothetical protein